MLGSVTQPRSRGKRLGCVQGTSGWRERPWELGKVQEMWGRQHLRFAWELGPRLLLTHGAEQPSGAGAGTDAAAEQPVPWRASEGGGEVYLQGLAEQKEGGVGKEERGGGHFIGGH